MEICIEFVGIKVDMLDWSGMLGNYVQRLPELPRFSFIRVAFGREEYILKASE